MAEHDLVFAQSMEIDGVRAECSCGWFSPDCPTMPTALECWRGHLADLEAEAPDAG